MDDRTILEVLRSQYRGDIERLEFLRASGCASYVAIAHDHRYLLKIINSAFMDSIKQSMDVLHYLAAHDFPAPRMLQTRDGRAILTVDDGAGACVLVLYEYIAGQEPSVVDYAEEIGALTGRLHLIMRDYPGRLPVRARPFFIGRYLRILQAKGYPHEKRSAYIALGNALWDRVRNLPYGYCHGDLHQGNLLVTPSGALYVLDFDTSCLAPRMFDVMVMCDTTDYFALTPDAMAAATSVLQRFVRGYSQHLSLSEAEISSFYDLVALRHFQLQATIVEMHDLDCIDEPFIDRQLAWLQSWRQQYDPDAPDIFPGV